MAAKQQRGFLRRRVVNTDPLGRPLLPVVDLADDLCIPQERNMNDVLLQCPGQYSWLSRRLKRPLERALGALRSGSPLQREAVKL